ncbi:hypothetical protein D9613_011756 [Agrocybe pediades]|uniref:Uncharacterized protein n=1 Tax=Agrocybe pediades TaxID=84607 RepID=A0A8H4QKP1_9AGAR|nr:hypothetical protein D9613_011756 [Agrocybe pediades]
MDPFSAQSIMSTSRRQVIVDDIDSSIHYGSSWVLRQDTRSTIGSRGAPFRGTLHSASSNTTSNTTFTGTSIAVFGSLDVRQVNGIQDPQWECIVDNISLRSTDAVIGLEENNYQLCSQQTLNDGPHDLVVRVTTQRDPKAFFAFAYLQYTPSPDADLSAKSIRIENDDPAIIYDGFGSLGFANLTQLNGATMKLDFIGQSLTWYGFIVKEILALQVPQYSIDGKAEQTMKLNGLLQTADSSLGNQVFFSTPDLGPGRHSLLVTHRGNDQQTALCLDFLVIVNSTFTETAGTVGNSSGTATDPGGSGGSKLGDSVIADGPGGKGKNYYVGAIVGGAIGAVAAIALLILAFIRHRRRKDRTSNSFPSQTSTQYHTPTTQITPFFPTSVNSDPPASGKSDAGYAKSHMADSSNYHIPLSSGSAVPSQSIYVGSSGASTSHAARSQREDAHSFITKKAGWI